MPIAVRVKWSPGSGPVSPPGGDQLPENQLPSSFRMSFDPTPTLPREAPLKSSFLAWKPSKKELPYLRDGPGARLWEKKKKQKTKFQQT